MKMAAVAAVMLLTATVLARAADTVADTRLIKRANRLDHLETLRRACAGETADVGALARACAPHQAPAERVLLERVGEALARVEALAPADRHEVRAVLATLTSGMIFDLTRFPGEDSKGLAAIETLEERIDGTCDRFQFVAGKITRDSEVAPLRIDFTQARCELVDGTDQPT